MTIPVNPPPTPHYELSSLDAEGRWPQNANDSAVAVIPRWHPKVTGSRLFTMLTTLALGTAKAVITYREADAIVVPVTLEWITSTIIFIIFLILENIESRKDPWPSWFFQVDVIGLLLRCGCKSLGRAVPRYQTDECDTNLLFKPSSPPITAHRLLVTACVIGFGSLKVVLSCRGFSTESTSVEWIFGGGVAILIYCLGLYEASSTRTLPFLFETDYSKQLRYLAGHALAFLVAAIFATAWGVCVVVVCRAFSSEHWLIQGWLVVWSTITFIMGFCGVAVMLTVVAGLLSPMTGWHPLHRFGWHQVKLGEDRSGMLASSERR